MTIYPVPQSQKILAGRTSFTARVNIVADPTIDKVTIDRAVQIIEDKGLIATVNTKADYKNSNIYLGVNGSKGIADRYASKVNVSRKVLDVSGKYDRHLLVLKDNKGKADVLILGENTDATFCGLASL